MGEPIRIPWAWPLNNREGDFSKDARHGNVMFEQDGQAFNVMKRPGTSSQVYAGLGTGQGLGALNGVLYGVSGDNFQILNSTAFTGSDQTAWGGTNATWSPRYGAATAVFKGRIWVMSGVFNAASVSAADIWSSTDGVNWTPNAGSAPWGQRQLFSAVVVGDKMYIMGGFSPATGLQHNDVWVTENGTDWTQVTAAAPWNARNSFALVASSSGMFLLGGTSPAIAAYDDVWYSADGKDWARLGTVTPPVWAPLGRTRFSALYFNSKIYVIGGQNNAAVDLNSVYSSPNGVEWTLETAAAFGAGRQHTAACVYGGRMWIFGGTIAGVETSNVYQAPASGTGAWTLIGAGMPFARAGAGAVVFSAKGSGNSTVFAPVPYVLGGGIAVPTNTVFLAIANIVVPSSIPLVPPSPNLPVTFNSFNTATRLLVKNEVGLWVYDAGTLTRVTDVGYPTYTVPGLVVLGGFAYVMDQTGLIYNCALDNPYYWPALNVLGADYEEDRGVALLKYLNYVVALGENTIQVFYDSGLQNGSPLQPYLNANARIGCCNRYTAMRVGNNIAWLSQTAERRWQVMVMDGVSPKAISTPYIEKILETQAFALSSARGFVAEIPGHLFYGLAFNLGGAGFSLVYDFVSGEWADWTTATGEAFFAAGATPVSTAGSNSPNLIQDYAGGTVRQISSTIYADNGTTPFPVYVRTGKVDNGNNRLKAWGRMDIIGDSVASTPSISYTDDDYNSYSAPRTVSMTSARPALFRNGSSRRRAWVYEQLDTNSMRIQSFELSFSQGT
jgi:hypothetical protein